MTTEFVPTHVIEAWGKCEEVILLDGVAYTRSEWDACDSADWEFTKKRGLLFQGRVIDGSSIRKLKK